jgi:uncharacterized protein (TIGR01777 family)
MRVLISGGGISGLTLASLLKLDARQFKFDVTLFESRLPEFSKQSSIGGGIGLWPPSQSVLRQLPQYHDFIEKHGYVMPAPSYRDESGKVLAKPQDGFDARFPVIGVNRDDLQQMLLANLESHSDVDIVYGEKVESYQRDGDEVLISTQDGTVHRGDLLIVCDGIHSSLRNALMSELDLPPIHPTDLGYTYFRANTIIPNGHPVKWWSKAFETWGLGHSKEYGNHMLRFGFVPLKPPEVFWFIATKTKSGHPFLSPSERVSVVDERSKDFLKELISTWMPISTEGGEVATDYSQLLDLTDKVLRTDIAKINDVGSFPWRSEDGRVILLGDAAHATAPNIAQGAGLCIEDAAELVAALDRADPLKGLATYEARRKVRAASVQRFADAIARVGQVENPLLRIMRNSFMRSTAILVPKLQGKIFDEAVSKSLGGDHHSPYWRHPESSLLEQLIADPGTLSKHVREFKTSPTGGSGQGYVTVEKPGLIAKCLGPLFGFPADMEKQPFYAEVTPNTDDSIHYWKRVFAANTPQQKTYKTTHSSYCDSLQQAYLSEGIGGWCDRLFRFLYKIEQQKDGVLRYASTGMSFMDRFSIPLPACLLPQSKWVERPTEKGWTFDGHISAPLIGNIMHYHGSFQPDPISPSTKGKRIIIAGGSGMIGQELCKSFAKKRYDVYCLSRSARTKLDIRGVKVRAIDDDWSDLIDVNTIVLNLSGSNPGANRWTNSVKDDIAMSRYKVIETIKANIDRAKETPRKYLQASAVGIYGNAGDRVLTEDSKAIASKDAGTQFRVEVCEEIERRANEANCPVVNLRIGHVLSKAGGLFPYYQRAGLLGLGRFGSGKQYVPFVHVEDVVRAIEFIANDNELIGTAINLVAPQPCTNQEMLKQLRFIKWIPGIPVPASLLKKLIGESAVILTDSERVEPKRLLSRGFTFDYPNISEAVNGLK